MFPWQRLRRKSFAFRIFLALLVGLSLTFLFWETIYDRSTPVRLPSSTTDPPSIDLPSATVVAMRSFKDYIVKEPNLLSTDASYKQRKQGKKGALNLHFWDEICGESLRSLRNFPLFPNMPTTRQTTTTLSISSYGTNYGVRIFGFLVPPETREYDIAIVSSGSAELWLSTSDDPRACKLVSRAGGEDSVDNFFLHYSRIKTVSLEQNRTYYIEALHKHGRKYEDYFAVQWKPSGKNTDFSNIHSKYIRSFQDDGHLLDYDVAFDSFPWARLPMHQKDQLPSQEEMERRIQSFDLPFFKDKASILFPKSPYSPSYTIKTESLRRYGSVWETHYTSVFPTNNSDIRSSIGYISFGNDALEKATAKKVVGMVSEQLKQKYEGQYTVQGILNVEQNRDPEEGDRYLVELIVQDTAYKKRLRFSEYLYQPKGVGKLFYPQNVSWNKSAVVNIIVTCGGNQLRWLHHFIDNMDHIYSITKDSNFNVIIVDFHDSVTELKAALERSTIPNYMLLQNRGKFHKTLAIQNAANMVKDPNAIVFVVDLHLDIPSNIFDEIRKHCIKGHVTYAPLLARLECGSTAHVPSGFWEVEGYGLIGMYKSDWIRFGGMNVEEYKHSWGGEDWEMADRILIAGLEIERLKVPYLYHYHHSKKGMWKDSHS